jgi:hypothetical protein
VSVAARWAGWDRYAPRSLPGPLGTLSTITFPTTDLRSRAQIALGADLTADPSTWAWQDISEYVRWQEGVTVWDGRRDGSETTYSRASLTLTDDGRFSRRNPNGPWYGLLGKITPIWLSVDPGDGMHTQYEGFIPEWPKSGIGAARDSVVIIECCGMLRLLT